MEKHKAIVVGTSFGGLRALEAVLSSFDKKFPVPIAVVQHLSADSPNHFAESLNGKVAITVKEAEDKEPLKPGIVYCAPANYHLLIETDFSSALSVDEKENYSRPSIDALFESAADTYGPGLVGVILTGSSSDGAKGLLKIKQMGGFIIAQSPDSSEAPAMPEAAIKTAGPDIILPLKEIGPFLRSLFSEGAP